MLQVVAHLTMRTKLEKLKEIITQCGSVAVAFSGGVDSAFLLKVCLDTLGENNVIALTLASPFMPVREINEAVDFCKENNIKHKVMDFDVLKAEGVKDNPANRCYYCKKSLFEEIIKVSDKEGISKVLDGSNAEDSLEYRPGMKAVEELGVLSPLASSDLTKEEIRILSKELNLPTHDKESFACLATRIAYGETITKTKLEMIDKAEQFLYEKGFRQFRVRLHRDISFIARIEVGRADMERVIDADICGYFKTLGFTYVTLDLDGYRSGSMNESLSELTGMGRR